MFELGKKDAEGAATPSPAPATRAPSAGTQRADSGQFAVIGRSIQINGDVKGDEDLVIEGDVSGTIELRNNSLTVGKEGSLNANVYARSITVDGKTNGDLYASERIAIRATADVKGNLLAPRVALEDGARFKGSIEMDPQLVEKTLGTGTSAARPSDSAASPKANGAATKGSSPAGAAASTSSQG